MIYFCLIVVVINFLYYNKKVNKKNKNIKCLNYLIIKNIYLGCK